MSIESKLSEASASEKSPEEEAQELFRKKEQFFHSAVNEATTLDELKFAIRLGSVGLNDEKVVWDNDAGFLPSDRMVDIVDQYANSKNPSLLSEGIERFVSKKLVELVGPAKN